MKIEELTESDFGKITEAVKAQLQKLADEKLEEALLLEIKASDKTSKEKLREYVTRTRRRPRLERHLVYDYGIENRELKAKLGISQYELSKSRRELQTEGVIVSFVDVEGIIRVRPKHWQNY